MTRYKGMMLCYVLIVTVISVRASKLPYFKLVNHLLNPERYHPDALPMEQVDRPILVKYGLALVQLIDLDEKNQVLTIKVWIRMSWTDANLRWNASAFGGITSVRIIANKIWRPDITISETLVETPNQAEKYFPAIVSNDGEVIWNSPAIFKSSCPLDVTYFPWDQQACQLTFTSWAYPGSMIDLDNRSAMGDLSSFIANGEWDLVGFPVRRHKVLYTCCGDVPYIDLSFWIVIRRKPLYYLFNMILPTVFITATTILVFYLPAAAGEKVSLGVTVLLALTVFLLIVADSVPTQSDSIPLISAYFGATIILLSLCTSMTVIILNIHHKGTLGQEVPDFVRILMFNCLAKLMFLKINYTIIPLNKTDKNTNKEKDCNPMTAINTWIDDFDLRLSRIENQAFVRNLCLLEDIKESREQKRKRQDIIIEWMLVSMVMDRLMLIVFILLTLCVSLSILLSHPHYNNDAEAYADQIDPNLEFQT